MNKADVRIAFFGTPKVSAYTLEHLIKAGYMVKLVVTESDKPSGRGLKTAPTPVKEVALKHHLTVKQPTDPATLLPLFKKEKIDLAVLVAYGKILPLALINAFKFGILNIHGSLLPKYRGAAPIQWAILNGDQYTGATIMLIDEKVDHGPILAKVKVKIEPDDTNTSLTQKIVSAGTKLLIDSLEDYLAGNLPLNEQSGKVTYAPKINKTDGLINWNDDPAKIERQIRAFNPWPRAYTTWRGQRLIIHQAQVKAGKLIPVQVQLAGKRAVSWKDFLNGYHLSHETALKELINNPSSANMQKGS